jgi:hypothetical protein
VTQTRAEQLEWEARAGRPAAVAAILAALFLVGGGIYVQTSYSGVDGADEFLAQIDASSADFLIGGVITAIGFGLLLPVLLFLYRATRFRRPETPRIALILAIVGPLGAMALGIARQIAFVGVAGDFTSAAPVPGTSAEDRAEDFVRDDGALQVISGIGLGANLALGFAIVLLSLNAMRAGLMSRFLGIIGIIVGVLTVLPLGGGPQIVQFFLLGALAALFLGRWPGGRGPAWDAGEAVPWPSAAEQAQMREEAQTAEAGSGNGRGGGDAPESADPDVPRPRSRKKKRKKR